MWILDDNSTASPTKALLELQMRLRAANSPRLVDCFLETRVMLLGQGGSAYTFERIHASARTGSKLGKSSCDLTAD